MSAKLSLKVKPNVDELKTITAAVEKFGETEQWPSDLVFKINLVLEELGLNIMNYGNDENLSDIEITLTSEEDVLTIEIVDSGRPFDPLNDAPEPDLDAVLEDRPVGGLGLYLVRTMMDDLRYRRENDKNYLTLAMRRGD